ncbi:MAG: GNAT family N-acetyltransferase [Candidatus Marinimicrobia bacterium]|nr:GNAT family N-acetyltransferase [Candidatus Neomarinimicrobiota bacterium]
MIIRSWDESMCEAEMMCHIENMTAHDYIPDPQEMIEDWQLHDPKYFHDKLVAEIDGQIVGCIHIGQGRKVNSHIFFFDLFVDPSHQNRGVGTALYNVFISKSRPLGCTKINSYIYDHPNWASGKSFLEKHKFEHISTNREYSLSLQNADFTVYEPLLNGVLSQGFTFVEPVKAGLNSNEHYKKLEAMRWSYFQDMPYPKGITPTRVNYDLWLQEHKLFEKEHYGIELLVLNSNGDYVGCTKLATYKTEPEKCWTSNLGVIKDYRRQKLATALKIEALKCLQKRGFTEIRTDNEENNPMYKINVNLGFTAVPFSLEYMKEI